MAFDRVGDADTADQNAANPTSVRNCVKRLMVRSSCGEALSRERISQPACGKARRASSVSRAGSRAPFALSGSFTR